MATTGQKAKEEFLSHVETCSECQKETCKSGFVRFPKVCRQGARLFLEWFEGKLETGEML